MQMDSLEPDSSLSVLEDKKDPVSQLFVSGKFERLLEEIEAGSGQVSATIRSVYDSDEQNEFEQALELRLLGNRKEIERMCNKNYQGFIEAVGKLDEVRGDADQLKDQIQKLDKSNQQSGANVLSKFIEMEQSRDVQLNVMRIIENLTMCTPVLEMYCRLLEQIDKKQHYGALKTLEHLEHVTLPKVAQYTFCNLMTERIPEIRQLIKKKSRADIREFLEKVREKSEYLGEVAMHQTLRHSSIDLPKDVVSRINPTQEQENDLCAQDLLNFSPVYKCLHIYSVLGAREEFESYYREQRHRQARLVLQQRHGQCQDSVHLFKSYFFQIAGFFVVEDTVLHTTQGLVTQAVAWDLWNMAVHRIMAVLRSHSTTCRDISVLMGIKELVVWFCQTMRSYGYCVDKLFELLLELREMYVDILMKNFADDFARDFRRSTFNPVSVKTEGEYQKVCSTLNFHEPELDREPFPKQFKFSELVLQTFNLLKDFIKNCNLFTYKLNLSHTDIDERVRKSINQLFQRTLSSQLNLLVRNTRLQVQQLAQVYVDFRHIEGACAELSKIIAKTTHTRTEGPHTLRMQGVQIMRDACKDCEEQMMILLCSKLSDFVESAEYEWECKPGIYHASKSRFIDDALHYVDIMLETFKSLPLELSRQLCITSCKHMSVEIQKLILSEEVPSISMNWFLSFDSDLTALEAYSQSAEVHRLGISSKEILQEYAPLRQLIKLALSGDWSGYITDFECNGPMYPDLLPSSVNTVIKKVRLSEFPKKSKKRGILHSKKDTNPSVEARENYYDMIIQRINGLPQTRPRENSV